MKKLDANTWVKNDCLQWVQNIAEFESIHIEYIEAARTTFLEELKHMDGSNALCVDVGNNNLPSKHRYILYDTQVWRNW